MLKVHRFDTFEYASLCKITGDALILLFCQLSQGTKDDTISLLLRIIDKVELLQIDHRFVVASFNADDHPVLVYRIRTFDKVNPMYMFEVMNISRGFDKKIRKIGHFVLQFGKAGELESFEVFLGYTDKLFFMVIYYHDNSPPSLSASFILWYSSSFSSISFLEASRATEI